MNLTMKGGDKFFVNDPIIVIQRLDGGYIYCLAVVKSEDINIIGQNFMTGYRMVFDREEMVLCWKESDCYDFINGLNILPVNKGGGAPQCCSFTFHLDPEATPESRAPSPASSRIPPPPPPPSSSLPGSDAAHLSSVTNGLLMVIVSIFFHHSIILSS